MSVDNSSWRIERDYPHPPERVFTAWAEPSLKVRWFDLSGNDNPDYRGDFRVGGMERFRTPDGVRPAFTYDAQYRDIVENERIVTTYEMSMDAQRTSVSVATVELHATPAGTHLVYTEQGAYLDGLDSPDSRRIGTTSQLDNLATVLKEQA
jgi:uncharacterized protein YndB with AHSA1/START domain